MKYKTCIDFSAICERPLFVDCMVVDYLVLCTFSSLCDFERENKDWLSFNRDRRRRDRDRDRNRHRLVEGLDHDRRLCQTMYYLFFFLNKLKVAYT